MIDSIGAGTQPVNPNEELNNQATISQDDFLDILLTQLTFQDPLKPLDNQEFVAQMAQFTNLEQTRQLNANSESLLTVQSATQSIGLIGKRVDVQTDTGLRNGIITTIRFSQGVPELTVFDDLGNTEILARLADVQTIREAQ